MNAENQKKLHKEFGSIYGSKRYSPRNKEWGFTIECGDGWYDLIHTMSAALMYEIRKEDPFWRFRPYIYMICEAWNTFMDLQPKWFQNEGIFGSYPRFKVYPFEGFFISNIKEKYGSMRISMNLETGPMINAQSQAQELSEKTCEQCGAEGKVRGKGWVYVACDNHTPEQDKEEESFS